MAVYLPVVTALLAGTGFAAGSVTLAIALGVAGLVLLVAVRYGRHISRFVSTDDPEKLLLVVLGLTLVVAGVAQQLQVSAAVGAFLVGIALSGEVAEGAHNLLAPLRDLFAAVFFVFFGLHTDPASIPRCCCPRSPWPSSPASRRSRPATGRHAVPGSRPRAGGGPAAPLVARGEFSIVIAGLAVTSGIDSDLGPLATAYVLLLVVLGPLTAPVHRAARPAADRPPRPGRGTGGRGRPGRPRTGPGGLGRPPLTTVARRRRRTVQPSPPSGTAHGSGAAARPPMGQGPGVLFLH